MGRGVLAVAVVVAAVLAGGASASRDVCPHPGTVGGASVLIECGSAKASIAFGKTHLVLKNGLCTKAAGLFTLAFGDIAAGPPSKHPPDSFQVIAGGNGAKASRDGTYSATVMATEADKNYIGDTMKLKLTKNVSAGTVSGTVTWALGTTKVAVSGSFTC
ncbi:MAG: hypothetical protein JOY72_01205 [Actinobacteria bacterium]|nr:hypothetical protein [Actinomycetota bacterium]